MVLLSIFISVALADINECTRAIQELEKDSVELELMTYYSGRNINDLGQYHECNELSYARYMLLITKIGPTNVVFGLCGPSKCSPNDYLADIHYFLEFFPDYSHLINPKSVSVVDPEVYNARPLDTSSKVSIIVILLLIILILSGTLISSSSHSKPLGWRSWLVCFSLSINFEKLTTLPETYNHLQLFNGIRVLGMLLISLGHSYVYTLMSPLINPLKSFEIMRDFPHHLMFIALYAVDLFFLISGFLLAFLSIGEMNKRKGKMNWMVFIAHRLFRICPIYYFVLMVYINILPHLGFGPAWPLMGYIYNKNCQDYWWTSALFINNFYPSGEVSCMNWGWFVTNDMQFYLFSPVILILHYKNKLYGYGILLVLLLVNVVVTIIGVVEEGYNPGVVYGLLNSYQFTHSYVRFYFRMGAFLMGMMFGFIYRGYIDETAKLKQVKEVELTSIDSSYELLIPENVNKGKIEYLELYLTDWVKHKCFRVAAYIVGVVMMVAVIFLPYNFETNGPESWSTASKALYMAFEHIAFSLGLMLILMPMVEGFGGKVLKFLTYKYFAVIAKISFTYYLVHPLLIHYYAFNRHQGMYLQDIQVIYPWFSTAILTVFVATIFTLAIESPLVSLEKKIFRRSNH